MTLLLGMGVGAVIAGMAFLIGYGAGIATVSLEDESQGDDFASEPLRWPARDGSVINPLPSTPVPTLDFGPPLNRERM